MYEERKLERKEKIKKIINEKKYQEEMKTEKLKGWLMTIEESIIKRNIKQIEMEERSMKYLKNKSSQILLHEIQYENSNRILIEERKLKQLKENNNFMFYGKNIDSNIPGPGNYNIN